MRNTVGFPKMRQAPLPLLLVIALALSALLPAVGCAPSAGSHVGAAGQNLAPEETIAQKNEWADGIVNAALDNLMADGVIARPKSDTTSLVEKFAFEKIDYGYGIAFRDQAAGKALTGKYALPQGKVVLCRFGRDMSAEEPRYGVRPEYADGDWVNEEVGEDVPLFYPESLEGHFTKEGAEAILANVPADAFADSFGECDYLVVYDSGVSHVDEGYYTGGIDRKSVTTLVFVIDAREGKVVHIENIGTSTPAAAVQMGQQQGKMLWDECGAYLNALLTSRSG